MRRTSKSLILASGAILSLVAALSASSAIAQSPESLPEKIYICNGQDLNDKSLMKATILGAPGKVLVRNYSYDQGVFVPDSGFKASPVKRGSDNPDDPIFTIGFTISKIVNSVFNIVVAFVGK